jgi:D-3-phosphoglycerate dehydrogenase / 2-oxoglutarate reductase
MKILANDGISKAGIDKLEKAGFTVITQKIDQTMLIEEINKQNIEILLVRSATKVRRDIIEGCPGLKLIGRGGVGIDNIDAEVAKAKGIPVVNTPASSSQSVAELVFGKMFSLARYTYDSDRQMHMKGVTAFEELKKKYAKGTELRGKTLGIIGFGRIGQSLASYALGCGMKVICSDVFDVNTVITIEINGDQKVSVKVPKISMDQLITESDFISIHVPKQANGQAVLGAAEIAKMKTGVILLNAARGGVIDESALLDALNIGKVRGAALDVFENEPTPREELVKHSKISSTPHIGAATIEAQDRIGEELADIIISKFK